VAGVLRGPQLERHRRQEGRHAGQERGLLTGHRLHRQQTASAALGRLDDAELVSLVDAAPAGEVGVGGGSATLSIGTADGTVPVFAKRIPLTDRELARPHDTSNLFDLPLFCQYGVGISPGFGAWRELAANQVVTEAVLAGTSHAFPLLYHWRVLPGRSALAAEHADIDAVVARAGDSAAVRRRFEELAAASHSLVLFFEHLPLPLTDWLRDDPVAKAPVLERQLFDIVASLRSAELLHMDGHFANLRTDGQHAFLTDFGLATSPHFDLSAEERDFVRRHASHDADYAAMRLVNWLVTSVCGVTDVGVPVARNAYVRRCADGHVPDDVPPVVAAILARHSAAAAAMNSLYWRLFDDDLTVQYQ
jgi:hypothetical protein